MNIKLVDSPIQIPSLVTNTRDYINAITVAITKQILSKL
jgi:hypothetical protein